MSQTQGERATMIARNLTHILPDLTSARDELRDLLGESQNAPPKGAADGTIDADRWARMNVVSGALDALCRLLGA